MGVLPACVYVHHEHSWFPQKVLDSLELKTAFCGLLCGCWETNIGSVEEQRVLLIIEPSLQPEILYWNFSWKV